MGLRRVLDLAPLLCLLIVVLVLPPGGSVLLVYNTGQHPPTTRRFEDVPAAKGFGPRVPEEGFAGRLELAQPDKYACLPLDGPVKAKDIAPPPTATASTADESPVDDTATATMPTQGTTHAHAGGVASRRGWGRLDSDSPSRYTSRHPRSAEVLEEGEEGEELPSAVLISRSVMNEPGACTFEAKVLNAQAAGFSMVVVYDFEQENMFQMGRSTAKGSHYLPVEIPLVLVTHSTGLDLISLIAATSDPRGPEIYLDNTDPFGMFVTVNLTMFMVVTGFMLALLTCGSMMVVTLHRYLRRYESLVAGTNRPMSLPEVLQLPEVCVEAGSRLEGDSCPVCLEPYRLGDKLRNLPCQHAFHAGCITPWLTQRQRTCPMCKDPITIRPASAPSSPYSTPLTVLPAPMVGQELASIAGGEGEGAGRGGVGVGVRGDDDGVGGDRLPLLSNSRGVASDGGSIQETPPV